ncbi:MAG: hypothetical protein IT495_20920 [Gammaproteobacteria bacterium]|nr:hypothetical protein [Gammaproteobacteria bacterium]
MLTDDVTRFVAALLAAAALVLAGPALATGATMLELLEVLRDNGTINQQAFELLRNSALADQEQVEARAAGGDAAVKAQVQEVVKEQVEAAAADMPKIETRDKLKISSTDGDFEWQLIGRLMVDYNLIDSDATKLGSGAEVRRARLGIAGRLWQHWIWKTEWDFAGAEVDAKDQFIGYEQDSWWVKLGQHHVPFGLATMSSSKYMLFIERPLLADNVLQPSRRLGLSMFNHWGERATLQAGVFAGTDGEDPDGCLSGFDECDEQVSFAVRGTYNPLVQDATHLLHLGAAAMYLDPQDSGLRVRQRPGVFHVVDTRWQDANFGVNAVDDVFAWNFEAAAVWGPVSLQGEYTRWDVSRTRTAGTPVTAAAPVDVSLHGYYVEAGWFITGEAMNFKAADGQYGSVKPRSVVGKGGIGAWQIAVRFDSMDLNDAGAGVVAGEQQALSIGVNWYATNTIRFMADYVSVLDSDRPGSIHDGDEPGALLVRGQIFW